LEAAGDLLRRRRRIPCETTRIDSALESIPEQALHEWLEGVNADQVQKRIEQAADHAVEAAIPEVDAEASTLATWAMQGLLSRDRLESARYALNRMASRGRPGATVAARRLNDALHRADAGGKRVVPRLTALNTERRQELALLDDEEQAASWWWSADSGLEHDGLVRSLSGEGAGSLSSEARSAHELVMRKRPRRFSFDELFKFDLGLSTLDEANSLLASSQRDAELALTLRAMEVGDSAIEEVTKDQHPPSKGVEPVPTPSDTMTETVVDRAECKVLVLRTKHRVELVVQPQRQDRFAAAAVYLPNRFQRSVHSAPGPYGLHFDVGSPEQVRGVTVTVVVRLADGRNLTDEVAL
jgi:hypothetical protein